MAWWFSFRLDALKRWLAQARLGRVFFAGWKPVPSIGSQTGRQAAGCRDYVELQPLSQQSLGPETLRAFGRRSSPGLLPGGNARCLWATEDRPFRVETTIGKTLYRVAGPLRTRRRRRR